MPEATPETPSSCFGAGGGLVTSFIAPDLLRRGFPPRVGRAAGLPARNPLIAA